MIIYLKALFEDLAGYPDHCAEHSSHSTGQRLHLHTGSSADKHSACGTDSETMTLAVCPLFSFARLAWGHFLALPQPFTSTVQQPSCCGVQLKSLRDRQKCSHLL